MRLKVGDPPIAAIGGYWRASPTISLVEETVEPDAFPLNMAGLDADLDFVHHRYYWGGSEKKLTDFETLTMGASTITSQGLLVSGTFDITILLADIGFSSPGSAALSFYGASLPSGSETMINIDNGANTNRVTLLWNASGSTDVLVRSGDVSQGGPNGMGTAPAGSVNGLAGSWNTDSILGSLNGNNCVADTVATLPSGLTTLRFGKQLTGGAPFTRYIRRVMLFDDIKTQDELQVISKYLQIAG